MAGGYACQSTTWERWTSGCSQGPKLISTSVAAMLLRPRPSTSPPCSSFRLCCLPLVLVPRYACTPGRHRLLSRLGSMHLFLFHGRSDYVLGRPRPQHSPSCCCCIISYRLPRTYMLALCTLIRHRHTSPILSFTFTCTFEPARASTPDVYLFVPYPT